jgi:hypothetical protein
VGDFHHAFPFAQQILRVGKRQALQEILGRNPRPDGEQPVKMERTQAGISRQARQIGLIGLVFLKIAYDGGDAQVIVHGGIVTQRDEASHPILAEKDSRFSVLTADSPHRLHGQEPSRTECGHHLHGYGE